MIIPKMLINQIAGTLTKHFKLDKIMNYVFEDNELDSKVKCLEEKVKLNNKRINHSVDTNTELWNELAKFKRLVLGNKDDWQGTTLSADKNKK